MDVAANWTEEGFCRSVYATRHRHRDMGGGNVDLIRAKRSIHHLKLYAHSNAGINRRRPRDHIAVFSPMASAKQQAAPGNHLGISSLLGRGGVASESWVAKSAQLTGRKPWWKPFALTNKRLNRVASRYRFRYSSIDSRFVASSSASGAKPSMITSLQQKIALEKELNTIVFATTSISVKTRKNPVEDGREAINSAAKTRRHPSSRSRTGVWWADAFRPHHQAASTQRRFPCSPMWGLPRPRYFVDAAFAVERDRTRMLATYRAGAVRRT